MKTPKAKTSSKSKPKQPARRIGWKLCLLIVAAAAFIAYFNSLSGEFVFDDETQILRNPTIRSFENLPKALTSSFWSFYPAALSNYYRPLQTVDYMIGYSVGGLSPRPYHELNVAGHMLASAAVAGICLELGLDVSYALIGGLLFAVHPVHTEAVSWIAGAADVICGLFYACALWAALRYINTRRVVWTVMAGVCFFAALMGKEMAVTLPAVILILAWYRTRSEGSRNKLFLPLMTPIVAAGLGYGALRLTSVGLHVSSSLQVQANWWDWITLGVECIAQYVRYALAPYPLVALHLIPVSFADRVGSSLISLAVISLLAALIWRWRRTASDLAAWLAVFLVTLAPVLLLKAISSDSFFAERYLYIPSIAVAVFAASVLQRLRGSRWHRPAVFAAYGIVVLFGVATIVRNEDWESAERLYRATIEKQPEVVGFHTSLAAIDLTRNDDSSARQNLEAALKAWDDKRFAQIPFDGYRVYVGLAALEIRAEHYDKARSYLQEALRIYPQGDWAYAYLGVVNMDGDHNMPEAIRNLKQAVTLGPMNEVAHDYLGAAFFNQGDYKQAEQFFSDALQINPTYADARAHLDMVRQHPR